MPGVYVNCHKHWKNYCSSRPSSLLNNTEPIEYAVVNVILAMGLWCHCEGERDGWRRDAVLLANCKASSQRGRFNIFVTECLYQRGNLRTMMCFSLSKPNRRCPQWLLQSGTMSSDKAFV